MAGDKYTVSVEIDSKNAKKGRDEVLAAMRQIEQKSLDLRKELGLLAAAFSGTFVGAKNVVTTLTQSMNAAERQAKKLREELAKIRNRTVYVDVVTRQRNEQAGGRTTTERSSDIRPDTSGVTPTGRDVVVHSSVAKSSPDIAGTALVRSLSDLGRAIQTWRGEFLRPTGFADTVAKAIGAEVRKALPPPQRLLSGPGEFARVGSGRGLRGMIEGMGIPWQAGDRTLPRFEPRRGITGTEDGTLRQQNEAENLRRARDAIRRTATDAEIISTEMSKMAQFSAGAASLWQAFRSSVSSLASRAAGMAQSIGGAVGGFGGRGGGGGGGNGGGGPAAAGPAMPGGGGPAAASSMATAGARMATAANIALRASLMGVGLGAYFAWQALRAGGSAISTLMGWLSSLYNGFSTLSYGIRKLVFGFGNMYLAFKGIQFAKQFATGTDEMIRLERQMMVATGAAMGAKDGFNKFRDSMDSAFNIAQKTSAPLDEVTGVFARFQRIMGNWGATTKDVEDLTFTISAGMKASGASVQETTAVLRQYSQALNKAKLDGDEMVTFAESAGFLMQVAEKQMGMRWAQIVENMKKAGKAGKDAIGAFNNALMNARPFMEQVLSDLPQTIEGAFQKLQNSWMKTVSKIGKETGFHDEVVRAIDAIRGKIEGPEMQEALRRLVGYFRDISNYLIDWMTKGENFIVTLEKIGATFRKQFSSIGAFFTNPTKNFDEVSKEIDKLNKLRGASPFGAIYDPAGAAEAAKRLNFDEIEKRLNKMPDLPFRFNDQEVKSRVSGLLAQIELDGESMSVRLAESAKKGLISVPQATLDLVDTLVKKIQVAQSQVANNAMSEEVRNNVANWAEQLQQHLATVRTNIANLVIDVDEFKRGMAEAAEKIGNPATLKNEDALAKALKEYKFYTDQIAATPGGMEGIESRANSMRSVVNDLAGAVVNLNRALGVVPQDVSGTTPRTEAKLDNTNPRSNIKYPPAVKTGSDRKEDAFKQRLDVLRDEIALRKSEMTMGRAASEDEKLKLEITKAVRETDKDITEEMKKQMVELVKQKHQLEQNLAVYNRFKELGEGIGNTLADVFMEGAKNGEKFTQMLRKATAQILEMTVRILLLKPMIESMGRGLGTIGSSMFPNTGSGSMGNFFANGLFANGGAFSGGMQVHAFASGGIVSKPVLFPMARGAGLMGEAGPEAIMPLTRMPNGKLGVHAGDAGGGGTVDARTVVINVAGDLTDETYARIHSQIERHYASRERITIERAKGAVARENRDNPRYMRR